MTFKPRQPRIRDRAYLDWIKQLPCLACAVERRMVYGVDPAHIRHGFKPWRPTGAGERPDDFRCAPLCRPHHDEQHSMSEPAWWARLGVDPVDLCADLLSCYPNVGLGSAQVMHIADGARRIKRAPERAGGLTTPIDAAPKPVTISAHATDRRDADGNCEVILPGVRASVRAFVAPDAVVAR